MDPTQTLKELRALTKEFLDGGYTLNNGTLIPLEQWQFDEVSHLIAEKFQALDEWMQRGGFNPWEVKE